jgi:hypothetical protein
MRKKGDRQWHGSILLLVGLPGVMLGALYSPAMSITGTNVSMQPALPGDRSATDL